MKKETLQNIIYSPLYLWFKLHALLPMRVLYLLADLLYYPLYYVVHYRRRLVLENMRNAFPDKSEQELIRLEKKFYRHFCDYIVETIKLLHISDEEMRRRMVFEQTDIIDRLFDQNRSIIILLGHFGNWEWVPSVTLWIHHPEAISGQIYRPLKNEWFDRFFLKLRSRFGTICIAKKESLRAILQMKRSGRPSDYGVHVGPDAVAGQHPPLGPVPFARLTRAHRLRKDCPQNRLCRALFRCRSGKTRVLQSDHPRGGPATQRAARVRNHRPLYRPDGEDHPAQPLGLAVDPQTLEIQTRRFPQYLI